METMGTVKTKGNKAVRLLQPTSKTKCAFGFSHVPNAATLEALEEAEHPEKLKRYNSVAEMLADILK
ncbi:hypothetical protein Barb6_03696 [Bacteroidales bacterium Barb6]|nr:hypothetical protein Barb6_03696 [Bacteroidales bacterium Barb6]